MDFLDSFVRHLKHQPETYDKKKLFQFGKVLGSGAYGEVKEAILLEKNQKVAIKIIRKSIVQGREDLVDTELRVVGKLDHPHIIKLLDWFESRDKYYLVFELATGGELFDRICQKGRFTEKDAAELAKTIIEAIDYMHKNHVVHRDLKPENLLYKDPSEQAPLLIADFGIAKSVDSEDQVMTTVCGSYGYTAPEILLHQGYGKAVDMWSLGVITYAMLCGYTPFPMDDGDQFLRLARAGKVEFHPAYWRNISDEAKDFVKILLSPNPDARPSAEEALTHPWILKCVSQPPEDAIDLITNVRANFNARRQFMKGINAVRMMNRMRHLSQSNIDPNKIADEATSGEKGGDVKTTTTTTATANK